MSVRKSAYGRTQLFLPSTTTLMREVKCMGGVTQYANASVYHLLSHESKCCWHCAEPVRDPKRRIALPRLYDADEGVYHVYGCACSPGCAKAYVLEHTTFDRGQHLNVLVRMLREVYGVTDPVRAAPPRPALLRWGGPFDPRKQTKAECRLVEPPFVSYCMLAEERVPAEELAEEEDKDKEPALYESFVRDRVPAPPATPVPKEPAKRKRDVEGPLSKFVQPP